jgi:hypothetical protein
MSEVNTSTDSVPAHGDGWISAADKLPTMERLVVFTLKANREFLILGFRDCPRAYCDRNPRADHFGWALTTWWTDAKSESEAWDDDQVAYWHPLAELPA